jgi:predicted transcriptional regulator
MSKLSEIIQGHLSKQTLSARAFADQVGVSYPTLLSLLNNGHVPRRPEHRESLRLALGCDHDGWANVLASSRDGIELPSDDLCTLQQLVVKALYSQGFSEQSFARATGVPYPTILGITGKGAIPRRDTLDVIADALSLEKTVVEQAVENSKTARRSEERVADEMPIPVGASLKEQVAAVIERSGLSVAAFAREHDMPYLSLMKLLDAGVTPSQEVQDQLKKTVSAAMDQDMSDELPPSVQIVKVPAERALLSPFQKALTDYIDQHALTLKAFAERCDVSVVTATRMARFGILPGRAGTHEKIRALLNLNEDDYARLIKDSTVATHADTTQVLRAMASQRPIIPDLLEVIERLNERQQQALQQFLTKLL